MDIQIYLIRMDHPRIPMEAARSRGKTRGSVREQLLAFQLTHNSDVHDWESGPASHPDEEQRNASIVHLTPCYHPQCLYQNPKGQFILDVRVVVVRLLL